MRDYEKVAMRCRAETNDKGVDKGVRREERMSE
jgi:hypothetical protein